MRSHDGGYRRFLRRPFNRKPALRELHQAIGGDFAAFGVIERELLKSYGLSASDRLIDVGCGAGRLAAALEGWFAGSYLGTDVVSSLLAAARASVTRSDWRFVEVHGTTIPAADESVDMVCMFSVITHLLHEDAYAYLSEARRVLRVGGRIVFSFIEFRDGNHWQHFARSLADSRTEKKLPLTMFLSREAISAWAEHLDLRIVDVRDGTDEFVPLPHALRLESGRVMENRACLGHAVCVLERVGSANE